jgi:hypothetical protein
MASLGTTKLYGQVDSMIVGAFDRQELEEIPYETWYDSEYNDYVPDQIVLDKIESLQDIEILICLGTWCSDSRREVPRFLKILDALNVSTKQYDLVGLDRKKSAPDFEARQWNIEFVPTFIVLKNGLEIGRIIETPELTLEEDLVKILE